MKGHLIWDDVVFCATVDCAHSHHGRVCWFECAADNGLELHNHHGGKHHRVNRLVGRSAMGADPLDNYVNHFSIGHGVAFAKTHAAGRYHRTAVQGQTIVGLAKTFI